MKERIEQLSAKKLVGLKESMTFVNNKTSFLWQTFMPRRKEIQNTKGTELYSIQRYSPQFFEPFNPHQSFDKWACVEVENFDNLPAQMEAFELESGCYVVFSYKGSANDAEATFRYIFETWLPASIYKLDDRPHFEIIGEKYKNNDPNSEEEIWIPIKLK